MNLSFRTKILLVVVSALVEESAAAAEELFDFVNQFRIPGNDVMRSTGRPALPAPRL